MGKIFEKYINEIKKLPEGKLQKQDILNSKFLIDEFQNMKIYYAPHNEYLNCKAQIVIVGICPGWTQTEIAFRNAKKGLDENIKIEKILKHCKEEARFAGSMRKNIINMLDEISLPIKINLKSSAELFENNNLLHTTSLIPYPVFINERNYTGHTPAIIESDFLMSYVEKHFFKEIKTFNKPPLIIPLGKAVEDVLRLIIKKNIITEEQCLFGFPHPSGANGHRKEQFNQNKNMLIDKIDLYFSTSN